MVGSDRHLIRVSVINLSAHVLFCALKHCGSIGYIFSDVVHLVLAANSLKRRAENPVSSLRAPSRLRPPFERDTLTPDSDKTRSEII